MAGISGLNVVLWPDKAHLDRIEERGAISATNFRLLHSPPIQSVNGVLCGGIAVLVAGIRHRLFDYLPRLPTPLPIELPLLSPVRLFLGVMVQRVHALDRRPRWRISGEWLRRPLCWTADARAFRRAADASAFGWLVRRPDHYRWKAMTIVPFSAAVPVLVNTRTAEPAEQVTLVGTMPGVVLVPERMSNSGVDVAVIRELVNVNV